MNPVFESTSALGTHPAAWTVQPPRGLARILQAAGGTLGVLAIGLGMAAVLARPGDASPAWLAIAAAIAALALLLAAGAVERRVTADLGWIDQPSGLYNRLGLLRAGDALLAQARRAGRPVSLVLIDFDDLMEVRTIYGRDVARKVQARVVRKIQAIAGARGLAARTDQTQFAVLLPGANRERAQAIVQRAMGKPSRIEFDAGDSEIVLVPDILCEMAEPGVETVDELVREVAGNLAELRQHELRRQVWLRRERERHSRPMSIPASGH